MPDSGLITSILIIQLIAVLGAYFFSYLSSRIGNLRALMVAVGIWIAIMLQAYLTHTANEFYMLAASVGLVMGGIQSLSRSSYSKMLPKTKDHASYFSFYDVAEKLGIVLGTLVYGVIYQQTGSTRNTRFALILFFVLGMILLINTQRYSKRIDT